MTKFKRSASHPYALITPATPLEELEEFLKTNIFALGSSLRSHWLWAVS
jgi:hypothetical protein